MKKSFSLSAIAAVAFCLSVGSSPPVSASPQPVLKVASALSSDSDDVDHDRYCFTGYGETIDCGVDYTTWLAGTRICRCPGEWVSTSIICHQSPIDVTHYPSGDVVPTPTGQAGCAQLPPLEEGYCAQWEYQFSVTNWCDWSPIDDYLGACDYEIKATGQFRLEIHSAGPDDCPEEQ